MKNFTKTLAAAAIIIFSTGIESASAHRIAADAAELKTSEVRVENTTNDIAMPRCIADKSFDIEIHEIIANDKADSAANYVKLMDWLIEKIKNPFNWG